jgi:microsomal dipeptidase-like Zn-dependent dipeptidase
MKIFILILFFSMTVYAKNQRYFADLHNHMFGHEAWDGGWFHGRPTGPESEALTPCSGNESFFGDHGSVIHPWLSTKIFKSKDVGTHPKNGYPNYLTWPRWDTVSHQQMWEGHLKQAWSSGLRFMIVSFYNNNLICALMRNKATVKTCHDMDAVDRQFSAYEHFLQGHDENDPKKPKRSEWVVHASSADEARKALEQGKLVLIPSIEVSDLFPDDKGDWKKQFQKYYDRGLRTLQIVHQFNNRFAGAALHDKVLGYGQYFMNKKWFEIQNGANQLGLTSEGKELIKIMMDKKMMIDVAHLSEKGVKDIFELTQLDGHYYPTYNSHTHARTMMDNVRSTYEKSTTDHFFDYHQKVGGVIGLRTGNDHTHPFEDGKIVPNDCQGSSKSFSQSYLFLDKKVSIAFGSDLNGFITQMKPRFGADATCEKPQTNPLNLPFDQTGYGHIGQIGNILDELENFGVNTQNISRSAWSFVEMWEKSEDPKKRIKIIEDWKL